MARLLLSENATDIYAICTANSIDSDANGQLNAWVYPGWSLTISNSNHGAGQGRKRSFLLIKAELSSKYLQRLVTISRRYELNIGFSTREAGIYDEIYLIDPQNEFSPELLQPLDQDPDITLTKVPGQTPQQLADSLERLLEGN